MNELSKFQEQLAFLDVALTGNSWREALHTALSQAMIPEKFLAHEYYLSDGGYSRIHLNPDTLHIFLSSNSLETPKKNWRYCRELISDVEVTAQMYVAALEP